MPVAFQLKVEGCTECITELQTLNSVTEPQSHANNLPELHKISLRFQASHYANIFFIQCLETVAWNKTTTIS